MNATDVIWYDPLNYDPLRDGPPYLPNQGSGKVASSRAWLKEAHAMMGQDVLVAFQHCTAEYGNAPMAELAVVLACFRAEAMIHQAHHWQTRGSSYYGDHLLFERVYGEVNGFIDRIAERAVGSGQEILVQPLMQISHMVAFSKLFYSDAPLQPTPEEMPLLSLRALLKSSLLLQMAYTSLEQKDILSNGTDNLLQDIADKQESLSYLLKQRSKTKAASMTTMNPLKAFEHELLIRRVASRYVGAMEHATPEAMKKYLKEHPGADKSNHKVKKQDGEKGGGGDAHLKTTESDREALQGHMEALPGSAMRDAMKPIYHAVMNGNPVQRADAEKVLTAISEHKAEIEENGYGSNSEKAAAPKIEKLKKHLEKLTGKIRSSAKPSGGSKPAKKRAAPVKKVMEEHNLKDEDADELEDFKKRKPSTGKPLTDQQLMQKFLREASPETKERMKGMNVGDFKKMYAAIMDEVEGEG